MKTRTPVPLLLALPLAALVLGGCFGAVALGAAGGVAATKYTQNQVVREYRAPLRSVYDASLAVLPGLGYPAASTATLGPTEGRVKAGDASIGMALYPGGVVRVAVSVGTWDSRDNLRKAELVHERLAARLGLVPVSG